MIDNSLSVIYPPLRKRINALKGVPRACGCWRSENAELILDELRKENHFVHVEVCVKKDDAVAIHIYEKNGFVDSGYIDDQVPDALNLICYLHK